MTDSGPQIMREAEWSDVVEAWARAEREMVEGYMDGFDPDGAGVSSFPEEIGLQHRLSKNRCSEQ